MTFQEFCKNNLSIVGICCIFLSDKAVTVGNYAIIEINKLKAESWKLNMSERVTLALRSKQVYNSGRRQ